MNEQQRLEEEQRYWMEHPESPDALIRVNYPSITKESINNEINRLADAVDEGLVDPIKAVAIFAAVERVVSAAKKKIMDHAVDEYAKYKEREIIVLDGAHVSCVEAGVRYDFANTPAWQEIRDREQAVAEERKDLEQLLKSLKKPGMITIDDELVEANPPIRTSTTTLKITIK